MSDAPRPVRMEPASPRATGARRFRKKPVVIEAWQWLSDDDDWPEWLSTYHRDEASQERCYSVQGELFIPTLEGMMTAQYGDWIIRGIEGEVYPCKPNVFAATYEIEPSQDAADTGNRLTLWVSPEAREAIDKIAAEFGGISVAEVIQRSLGTELFIFEQQAEGGRVLVESADGEIRELTLKPRPASEVTPNAPPSSASAKES